jgi:hypothetical protein
VRLFDTDALWTAVAARLPERNAWPSLLALAAVGAAGVTLAAEFGVRHFDGAWNSVLGYSARPDEDGTRVALLWTALFLLPFAQAIAALAVLPFYSAPRRPLAAVAVFCVGSVPLYVAGLALVVAPGILLMAAALFVSLAWWSQGARALLGVPAGETLEFVTVTLLAASALLGLASTAFPF